ncbi:MAG: polysaccharide deacetylase [Schwartzia sp.]|nr:polysaccharide deacetylase [Schwartzia sp. (in: firmicutes)]
MQDTSKRFIKRFSPLAFALVAAAFLSAACAGGSPGKEGAAPAAQTQQAQTETKQETKKEEARPQLPSNCVVAADDFSNLQLDDPTKPVFDRYTLAQRRELGLPVELPAIKPFTGKKVAYLTFDDGPDPVVTPQILDILADEGVPATFYVLGGNAEEYPELVKRMVKEGHAVGGHSYDHDYDALYASTNEFIWQAEHTDKVIHSIIGARPLILRAPGGAMGMFEDGYDEALRANGYVEHDWNVCTNDATPEDPDAAAQIGHVDAQTSGELKDDMALVLMHSTYGKQETANALRGIIEVLRERGFTFGVVTPMTPQPL